MTNLKTTISTVLVTLCVFLLPGQIQASTVEGKVMATAETKVRLENGVEVELVAVSNWQWEQVWERHRKARGTPQDQVVDLWWRPDGTLLEDVDFRRGRQASGNVNTFNFLVRATGLGDADMVACRKAGGEVHRVYVGDIHDQQRTPVESRHVFYIRGFPYPPTAASLFVGITGGDWHVVEGQRHDWAEYEPDTISWSFDQALVAKWPYQKGQDVVIELTHTYVNAQTRLEITDTKGRTHIAHERQRGTGVGIVTVHYTFKDTKLEDVGEIRFMKRDYTQWIEFKDVTLAFDGIKPFYTWGRMLELKGKPAPEFAQIQEWSTGTPLKIADLKGKVILLDFWNVNCSPCVALFPELMSLHDRYSKEGLMIVGVHADIGLGVTQAKERMSIFKEKYWGGRDVPFPIAFDGGGDAKRPGTTATSWGATNAAYAIRSYPTSILIDKNGNVHGQINLYKPGHEKEIESLLRR
ncbi:MAG: TlpA family protein disulfide reductase [Phycisphaerales bacterium]|nr:MAG: TlpA family protein disulfide reductase [Phycisphaerales bacterium]